MDIVFILSNERIGDDIVGNEVEMDIGRELRNRKKFGFWVVDLLESPVLINRDYCMPGHVGG